MTHARSCAPEREAGLRRPRAAHTLVRCTDASCLSPYTAHVSWGFRTHQVPYAASRHTITTGHAHAGWPVGRPRWPTPPQGLCRTASALPPIKTQVPWCELLFPPLRRRSHGRRRGFLLLSSLLPPLSSSTPPLNPSKQSPADCSPALRRHHREFGFGGSFLARPPPMPIPASSISCSATHCP